MQQKTALIIDDEPLCLSLMKEILEDKGFVVLAYPDPESYLSEMETHCRMEEKPCADVIITDNKMPGMSGLEFLQMLKVSGCKLPDRCKAVISGSWDEEQAQMAEQIGCKIFHKPTPITVLYHWLDTYCTA